MLRQVVPRVSSSMSFLWYVVSPPSWHWYVSVILSERKTPAHVVQQRAVQTGAEERRNGQGLSVGAMEKTQEDPFYLSTSPMSSELPVRRPASRPAGRQPFGQPSSPPV